MSLNLHGNECQTIWKHPQDGNYNYVGVKIMWIFMIKQAVSQAGHYGTKYRCTVHGERSN